MIKDLEIQSGIFFNPDQASEKTTAALDGVIPKSRAFTSGTRDLPEHTAAMLKASQVPALETSKGSNSMAIHPNVRLCTHIKVNGVRCGSPALRGEIFCYFHQRLIRGVPTPPKSRLHPMAILEDEASIQTSLMEIVNALVRNQIDVNRARLVLRALHIAVKNAGKTRFGWVSNEMVSEVPEYPAAPEAPKPPDPVLEKAGVLSLINKPKPRWPTDYGMTYEQAIAYGFPPEDFDSPRPLPANPPQIAEIQSEQIQIQQINE